MKASTSLLIALAVGWLVIAAGLLALLRIFDTEEQEGVVAIQTEQRSLLDYGHRALADRLAAELLARLPAIDRAAEDPLAPAAGLFRWCAGEARVPPPRAPFSKSTAADTVRAIHQAIHSQRLATLGPTGDDPWSERLQLVERFIRALKDERSAEIESTFRAVLAHRERYQLPPERDLPAIIALLELLAAEANPDPALISSLLREGLPGSAAPGLFRGLLLARARIAPEDVEFLAGRLTALADRFQIEDQDFRRRIGETVSATVAAPPLASLPRLAGGAYFEREGASCIRGATVSLDRALAELSQEMLARGLLKEGERISGPIPPLDTSLRELPLGIVSDRFAGAAGELERRHRVKAALLGLTALLGLAIVLLSFVLRRKEARFVELKSDFVATVSHELRTPLAAIRVMAETLDRRLAEAPIEGARDYPARIVKEIDALSALVENILSFNRLDKGRWVARPSRIDLEELITDLGTEQATLAKKPLELSCEGLSGRTLWADAELLRLLFANLIRNACQYNAREKVEVKIHAEPAGADLLVSVSDNGIGIPLEQRSQLFQAFVRLDRPTERGVRGSGLGLALAGQVMELHRGTIRIADSSPAGTTFELRFRGAR